MDYRLFGLNTLLLLKCFILILESKYLLLLLLNFAELLFAFFLFDKQNTNFDAEMGYTYFFLYTTSSLTPSVDRSFLSYVLHTYES